MKENDISEIMQNEILPTNESQASKTCKKCGAKWEKEICPWCGADDSGTQILPFNFPFPAIKPGDSKWNSERSVPAGKAVFILLLSCIIGGGLYYLFPIIFAFTMLLNLVVLVLLIYALISFGIYFLISIIFKKLINIWGKGNNSWLLFLTSIIMFAPSTVKLIVVYWSSGAIQGIMSLILGLAIPILGFCGIAIYFGLISSGKFCPYCDSNLYLRKNILKIHSCHTGELIKRITENEPDIKFADLNNPEISNHAFTSVDLSVCKKEGCRHAQIEVYQNMMYEIYNKSSKQMEAKSVNQLVAEHEILDEIFDMWTKDWSGKDKLA